MSDKNLQIIVGGLDSENDRDDYIYRLADHIVHQNLNKAIFVHNVECGDPVWDFLLDLFASEHLDRPSSIADIARRIGSTVDLCNRYAAYLVEQSAIAENSNQFTATKLPFLMTESTKSAITAWLNNCMENFAKI